MPIYQGLSPQALATSDRYVRTPVTKSYYPTAAPTVAPETAAPQGFSIEDIDPEILKWLAENTEGGDNGEYTDGMPDNRTLSEKKTDSLVGMATAPNLSNFARKRAGTGALTTALNLAYGVPTQNAIIGGIKSAANLGSVPALLSLADAVVPSVRAGQKMRGELPAIKEQLSPIEYDRARSQAMISGTGEDPYRDSMLSDNELAATSPGELTDFSGMTAPAANDFTEDFRKSGGNMTSNAGIAKGMESIGYAPPKTGYNDAAFAVGNAVTEGRKGARPYTTQLWEDYIGPPVSKAVQSFKSQVMDSYIKPTMSRIMRSITGPTGLQNQGITQQMMGTTPPGDFSNIDFGGDAGVGSGDFVGDFQDAAGGMVSDTGMADAAASLGFTSPSAVTDYNFDHISFDDDKDDYGSSVGNDKGAAGISF